jgi:hypothetical protein
MALSGIVNPDLVLKIFQLRLFPLLILSPRFYNVLTTTVAVVR